LLNNSGEHAGNEGITILLVEDELSVRRLVSQMLMLTGYSVLEAANGPEALQLMEKQTVEIDLLLTDVVMPFMNGGELAERLARIYPRIRVLFTSGYMDDAVVQKVVALGAQFLPKPFSPDTLVKKVREVLEQPCQEPQTRPAETG
jgi:two-component system cell cycle sensor histidine kinase/response regulator CckA